MGARSRVVGTVVAATVVLAASAGAGALSELTSRDEGFVIDRFERDVVVDTDGRLTVEERLEVTYLEPRRGIVRELPSASQAGPVVYDGVSVDRGEPDEPWNVALEPQENRDLLIRIGDPGVTLEPGAYPYRIGYTIDDLAFVQRDDPEAAEVRIDVPGSGWPTEVGPTVLRVELPDEPREVACVEGDRGATSTCPEPQVSGSEVVAEVGPFEPGQTATVAIELDAAAFDGDLPVASSTPLQESDALPQLPVPGPVAGMLLALLLALPLGGFEAVKTVLVYRDEETDAHLHDRVHPTASLQPPRDLPPAETAGLLLRRDQDALFLSTLVDLDQRGRIASRTIPATEGEGLEVVPAPPGREPSPADAPFVEALLPDDRPTRFDGEYDADVASRASAASDVAVRRARDVFATNGLEHDRGGLLRSTPFEVLLAFVGLGVAVLLGVAIAAVTPLALVAAIAIVLVVVIGWLVLRWIWRYQRLPLNSAGRDAVAHARSFEEYLRTVEAEQLEWAASQETVDQHHPAVTLLPYAIAFGLADSWYERFEEVLHREPVSSGGGDAAAVGTAWWATGTGFAGVQTARSGSMVDPAASSGGGGGGAGSGGGGGGGGSW